METFSKIFGPHRKLVHVEETFTLEVFPHSAQHLTVREPGLSSALPSKLLSGVKRLGLSGTLTGIEIPTTSMRVHLRRTHLTIQKIQTVAGLWVQTYKEISKAAESYFENIFAKDPILSDGDFLDAILELVSLADNTTPFLPTSMEEVLAAIKPLNNDNAPGPDRFSGTFFILSTDIVDATSAFLEGLEYPTSTSSTFLALIPKNTNPTTFADFRPISVCNYINEVVARLSLPGYCRCSPRSSPMNKVAS